VPGTILVVDDEPNIVKTVQIGLESAGFAVTSTMNPLQGVELMREHTYDVALFDLKMRPIDGLQLLREARALAPEMTVIIMTAHGSIDSAVEAMKLGAHDYLQKPFEFAELLHFVEKVFEYHRLRLEVLDLRQEISRREGTGEIVTRSERMRGVMELALQVAPSGISILIEGESGTGKELLAHLIHGQSPRKEKPFVAVNCTALAENLLESELFGHVRGAFTGAVKDRQGRFDLADGGTVFLDEIGEIPPAIQVKLLRFLQSKEFERVGETATRRVDVRVIAATNRDLENAVSTGAFREDLFYRLNAVRLKLPPLRERMEDIPMLVQHFLQKFGSGSVVKPEAVQALQSYPWRGNVRELENVIERAVILSRSGDIDLLHLPEEFRTGPQGSKALLSLDQMEQQHIIRVLKIAKDLEEAARILGIDPATLWRKRKKYGL
jgi:NtrC-family two-component system response regulator AlgB